MPSASSRTTEDHAAPLVADVLGESAKATPTWTPPPAAAAAVVTRSDQVQVAESRDLYHKRLTAATGFLLSVLLILLTRRILFGLWHFWYFQLAILVLIGAMTAVLSIREHFSTPQLKAIEAIVFGSCVVSLLLRQHTMMLLSIEPNDLSYQEAIKSTLICFLILMFTYCMLIPCSWKKAAGVVAVITFLPILTEAATRYTHPEVGQYVHLTVTTYNSRIENAMFLLVSGGLAVFGVHVINTLRAEAFEARRLNQYQLGRKLGAGGMGEVYLAEHRFLKRPCALKLIRPEAAGDAYVLSRFEREVRATARLSHPNTIEIYDFGRTEEGTFYYVMEYLPGRSLEDLVTEFGTLPPGRVIYLLRQACEALSEAHAAGIIHRDIKPANLFAAFRGGRCDVTKVLDFGLLKDTSDQQSPTLSVEGTVRGTPHFMSPEQVVADPNLDHRVDIYAIGAVAYCLLTGRPPFDHDSATRVMIAHARDPVEPPSSLNPVIPADLEYVVMRCLAKKPDERYPDAQYLADALARCSCASEWDAEKAAFWWSEHKIVPTASHATALITRP